MAESIMMSNLPHKGGMRMTVRQWVMVLRGDAIVSLIYEVRSLPQ
jgi:hypothetical protein